MTKWSDIQAQLLSSETSTSHHVSDNSLSDGVPSNGDMVHTYVL